MPLSEHEQRLLEQMEQALYAEDPKFATSLRSGASARGNRSRAALGVVTVLVGIAILMGGAITALVPLALVGFLVMLVGAVVAYTALTSKPAAVDAAAAADGSEAAPRPAARKQARGSSSFMNRLEDRWRRRRDEGLG